MAKQEKDVKALEKQILEEGVDLTKIPSWVLRMQMHSFYGANTYGMTAMSKMHEEMRNELLRRAKVCGGQKCSNK